MPDLANTIPHLSLIERALPHWRDQAEYWGESVATAILILIVGWSLARWVERAITAAFRPFHHLDPMFTGFCASLGRWAIVTFTGLAVLDRLGVQTTSLIAVLGAAGLAIGLALQGTLTNLAAGLMLLLFRPFHVGQSIECGALAGTVTKVALFHTDLTTADNILVVVPNSVLWGTSLKNDSHFSKRRTTLAVPLPLATADLDAAMAAIQGMMDTNTDILPDPAPSVTVAKINGADKTIELEVQFWTETSKQGGVKSALLADIWRTCLKA